VFAAASNLQAESGLPDVESPFSRVRRMDGCTRSRNECSKTATTNASNAKQASDGKEESLDRLIPLGRAHLRTAIAEYVAHYHAERNHQAIGNRLICGQPFLARRRRLLEPRPTIGFH
jgi:hypothetical protein